MAANEEFSGEFAEDAPGGSEADAILTVGRDKLVAALQNAGCTAVVIIDDSVPDIELVRGNLTASPVPPEALAGSASDLNPWPDDPDARWEWIQRAVDPRPFGERRIITTQIVREVTHTDPDWEGAFAEPLRELRDATNAFALSVVSPREWIAHGPKFGDDGARLPATGDSIPIDGVPVFLFDYDLSLAGRRDNEGLKLASDYLSQSSRWKSYCGVISHHFNDDHAVAKLRESFTAEDRDRLVLLSREKMGDVTVLADAFTSVFRAHAAQSLRTLGRRALATAHEQAMASLADIEVAPLVHAVVDLSYVEGISEFETLRRLYLIKFNRALDETDADGSELQRAMKEIRRFKLPSPETPPKELIRLENHERYSDIGVVNRKRLPVALGDVFQLRPPGQAKLKKFVVVTHPCDLMVRPAGMREALGGQKETTHAVLLPVSDSKIDDEGRGFPLRHANPDTDKTLYVRFRPALYLSLFVLDLCAFAENGAASMQSDATAPDSLPESGRALFERVRQRVASIVQHASAPPAPDTGTGAAGTIALVVPEGAFDGVIGRVEGNRLTYDCKRIMRLAPHVSYPLLLAYSHFAGRDAAAMSLAGTL